MAMLENPLFEFPRGFFSFQGTHPANQNPLKLKNLEYLYFLWILSDAPFLGGPGGPWPPQYFHNLLNRRGKFSKISITVLVVAPPMFDPKWRA